MSADKKALRISRVGFVAHSGMGTDSSDWSSDKPRGYTPYLDNMGVIFRHENGHELLVGWPNIRFIKREPEGK